jgi:hypothetical protein
MSRGACDSADTSFRPDMFEYNDASHEWDIPPQGRLSTEPDQPRSNMGAYSRNKSQNQSERNLPNNCISFRHINVAPIKHHSGLNFKIKAKNVKNMKEVQDQLIKQNKISYENPIYNPKKPKIYNKRNCSMVYNKCEHFCFKYIVGKSSM